MKYIYLIVIIFLLTSCEEQYQIEEYNYIPNNTIRLIRTEEDTSILINKDETYYLLLLNKENIEEIEVDYLIKYKYIEVDIDSDEKYILRDTLTLNDITFRLNNKIEINMNNTNICIYIKELDIDDYGECNFVYLYNIDKNFYITLNNDLLGLIYHSYTKFNYRFMHHLATLWIETYTIDTDSYLDIILDNNNLQVTSSKIKGKTIHKK